MRFYLQLHWMNVHTCRQSCLFIDRLNNNMFIGKSNVLKKTFFINIFCFIYCKILLLSSLPVVDSIVWIYFQNIVHTYFMASRGTANKLSHDMVKSLWPRTRISLGFSLFQGTTDWLFHNKQWNNCFITSLTIWFL